MLRIRERVSAPHAAQRVWLNLRQTASLGQRHFGNTIALLEDGATRGNGCLARWPSLPACPGLEDIAAARCATSNVLAGNVIDATDLLQLDIDLSRGASSFNWVAATDTQARLWSRPQDFRQLSCPRSFGFRGVCRKGTIEAY